MNKPWYRKGRGWFCTVDGKQIALGKTEEEAYENWKAIPQTTGSTTGPVSKNIMFHEAYSAYVEFAKRQIVNKSVSKKTVLDYLFYLERFMRVHGETYVEDLEPHHLTDWLNQQSTWGPSGQRAAIKAVTRVLSWAYCERRISVNPLEGYRKPPQTRRTQLVAVDEHRLMMETVRTNRSASPPDKQFALVLAAIRHTGGRPQDVANVRVEHVDSDVTCWTIPSHKRMRHTSQPKTVYLSPCLQTITRMVMNGRTNGPLFRGRRAKGEHTPLSVNAIGCRIKRLKKKLNLPAELIAYSYRHTYITDSLAAGLSTATVAELVGTSVTMIERNYGHLAKRHAHLRESAAKAVAAFKGS